ncbi:MAG: cobalamin-binding protein [Pseudomonadales bacterium]|nr:cobalamin-binding protein [Pseudomonadales bacterium]MDP7144088.1 cobalamin-binding protein [Pseudomonadales bacterium]MDP7359345.1 cobalamin-binding protein [Pseudomonadales bacterium]MDP7594683.1 cobalamin-binding protein [Pseudomonadales bacterium]HJN50375.1 cobalamin-binding protein [Pseudomonadales bacterium]
MRYRPLCLLTGAVVLCSAELACSDEIVVVDDIGRTVSVSEPAMRLVSLSPHITEMLFSIGVGDRIVGTVRFSDYPAEAAAIQRVGDAFSVNIEMLMQLEPDLVVAWHTGGSGRTINKIESLGVPVYFNEASNLAGIAESAAKISVLAGIAEAGAAKAQQFRRKLQLIRKQHQSDRRVKIFYQISDLNLYTVNRHHLIGEAIALCGGDNIFADSIIKVPQVSVEAVIAASTDLIVFSSGSDPTDDHWTSRWQPFATIPAVANGHLYSLPAAIITRPSFRMASGIERLCELIDKARSQSPVKE